MLPIFFGRNTFIWKNNLSLCISLLFLKGIRCKPQQDSARAGHTAEEPDQTRGVPEPLPDRQIRG